MWWALWSGGEQVAYEPFRRCNGIKWRQLNYRFDAIRDRRRDLGMSTMGMLTEHCMPRLVRRLVLRLLANIPYPHHVLLDLGCGCC